MNGNFRFKQMEAIELSAVEFSQIIASGKLISLDQSYI